MTASRLVTPLATLAVTAALVGIAAERSQDLGGLVSFLTSFGTVVAILALLSLGLNVQWGYTGVFNFGVAAFFMVGAYTAALIVKGPDRDPYVEYIGGFGDKLDFIPLLASDEWLPFLAGIAGAALVSGLLAFLLSIPTLRLREDYLAITTIGVAELLRRITIEERWLVNGSRVLTGVPQPLSGVVRTEDYKYLLFALVVVVLILVYLALERSIRSPWGRALRALREDELTTEASGKNVYAFKTQGFVVGAVLMGIGGAIYGYRSGSISPDTFTHFFATFIIWSMLIVGGSGNNKGAILGAYVVWAFWETTQLIQRYELPEFVQGRVAFVRDFTLGSLIVLVLLLRPQGLLPEERRVSIWVERRVRRLRRARAPDATGVGDTGPPGD